MLADSHIHLSHFSFENTFPYLNYNGTDFVLESDGTREQLIASMKAVGISFCMEPAIELDSNERLLALAEKHPGFLYPAVGVHPTRTYQYTTVDQSGRRVTKRLKQKEFRRLEQYARNPAVVAIGETGLDYHLERKEQHRLIQKVWFVRQLLLADRQNLPVVLHIRQADKDALRILRLFRHQLHGGVCHCFCGTAETAKAYTDLGLMLGIGGSLLQAPALCADLEEAVRRTPIEFLLLETDGPYVKPVCPPLTGKQRRKARNTSLILPAVARRIAELKDMTQEDVERITTANVLRLFARKGHPVQKEEGRIGMTMKIWVDDVRPVPDGYDIWCKSVNEAIGVLQSLPVDQAVFLDLDHDAGDYASDGGDYIRLLDFIEAEGLNADGRFSFHIHSMNIVGKQNMMLIIQRRGWNYRYF